MPESLDAAEWFLKRVLIAGAILLVVTLAIGFAAQRWFAPTPPPPAPPAVAAGTQSGAATVSLRIDFPDTFRIVYPSIPHAPNMTVLDAMKAAAARPPADHPLRFESSGSGTTAFLTRFEDTRNEGGGPSSRNWQFWINARIATTGIGTTTLGPGDRITWVFEPYRDNPTPPPSLSP